MWQILNPEIKSATLDFSSSGQDKVQISRLVSDGVELVNAIELVDWDSDDSQFLICEACGYTHCKPGDWVSVRRAGSLILILPASQHVWRQQKENTEYRPPHYLAKNGPAFLDLSTYETLRARITSFPETQQIRPLKMREAALLFQLDAPAEVLGEPPVVKSRRDLFLGSSEGDFVECLHQVEALLQRHYIDNSNAILRSLNNDEGTISLYLDAAAFEEWTALVSDGSDFRLLVNSSYVIAKEDQLHI